MRKKASLAKGSKDAPSPAAEARALKELNRSIVGLATSEVPRALLQKEDVLALFDCCLDGILAVAAG